MRVCFCLVRQAEEDERHPREADTEFPQRSSARDGLGYALGEFIELSVHIFLSFGVIGRNRSFPGILQRGDDAGVIGRPQA